MKTVHVYVYNTVYCTFGCFTLILNIAIFNKNSCEENFLPLEFPPIATIIKRKNVTDPFSWGDFFI